MYLIEALQHALVYITESVAINGANGKRQEVVNNLGMAILALQLNYQGACVEDLNEIALLEVQLLDDAPVPSITCPVCQSTSYHPMDIAKRYCGKCREKIPE